jgi:hypothetical protein
MATRAEVRQIRASGVRPFGLAPDSAHPEPAHITAVHGSGTIAGALAGRLGIRPAIWTMTMQYGTEADPSTPFVQVKSDFHYDLREPPSIEDALSWALARDSPDGPRSGNIFPPEISLDGASAGSTEIMVNGYRTTAPIMRLGAYSALQFRDDGVLVTVVSRYTGQHVPEIVRLEDLEPFLRRLEQLDRKDIAAMFSSWGGRPPG